MFQFIVDNFTALQGRGEKQVCVAFLFAPCSATALNRLQWSSFKLYIKKLSAISFQLFDLP